MNPKYLSSLMLFILSVATSLQAEDIYLGSGVKAGEITDSAAILLVRLTSTKGQNDQGLIPGAEGEARIRYSTNSSLTNARTTDWHAVDPKADWSHQFHLGDLPSGSRIFYQVDYRQDSGKPGQASTTYSFKTAPKRDERVPVMFHLTTCQDLHGSGTYVHMAAQRPDFCISDGDTVYYDGQGDARTVPEAYRAYQQMFGLPNMVAYYDHVGGYFMKDDHDYRWNDSDPYMKGRWVKATQKDPRARYTETKGNQKLDVAWLTHEEGIMVFKQVFPMGEKTYRTARWGKGLEIWMLENRDFRSPNSMPDGPGKSIWGAEQKAWLKETLLASDAEFKIVVSPNPIIGPDRIMKGDNQANLNGFWHEGQEFLDWIKQNNLKNVVLMCGDMHWQYHSIDQRNNRGVHEFSCGPTCDEHVQAVPPPYEGVDRPYSASRGGFLKVNYDPSGKLTCQFFSQEGEGLYSYTLKP